MSAAASRSANFSRMRGGASVAHEELSVCHECHAVVLQRCEDSHDLWHMGQGWSAPDDAGSLAP